MKIVYFIGAGASKAVEPTKVPSMLDFLNIAIENLEGPDDAQCVLAFNALANLGLFKLASKQIFDATKLSDKEWVLKYKNLFKSLPVILQGNLVSNKKIEALFSAASAADDIDDGEAFDRLTNLFAWLFFKLDNHLSEKLASGSNPYNALARAIASGSNTEHEHTFISFNYDIWLERALYNAIPSGKKLWHPGNGYRVKFSGLITPEDRISSRKIRDKAMTGAAFSDQVSVREFKDVPETHHVSVLKPHGSLSWGRSVDDDYALPVFMADEHGSPSYFENGIELYSLKIQDRNPGRFYPMVVPPAPSKARSGPTLWQIQRETRNAIQSADLVVVIGWSCPVTDEGYRSFIQQVVGERGSQIPRLLLCDISQSHSFYRQFENMFWPERKPVICRDGFGKSFIEKYQAVLQAPR